MVRPEVSIQYCGPVDPISFGDWGCIVTGRISSVIMPGAVGLQSPEGNARDVKEGSNQNRSASKTWPIVPDLPRREL